MAINKKLIHFDMTKQLFMSNANGLNNLTKPTNGIVGNIPYYSVVFLKDGYIWTHGHFINGTGIADSVSGNATISWSKITNKPSTFTPNAHTQAYTTLTGSGTTANQAIVSSGTANGWTLKTLGARAFDNTNYLPLAGGTMNAGAMIVWQDWGQWGASSPTYPKANGGLQWSGTSDNLKLFVEETASDDLRLILQCGDDASPQFNIRNYAGTTTVSLHSNGTITGTSIVNSGSNNNYILLGGGGTKLISDFATSGHTHSYLPLSGGTMTGAINLTNTNAKIAFGSLSTSPITSYKAPSLGSNGVGIYSRYGGSSDEGAIIITEDTCVIYNSADTGWNFQVMDKDLGTDMTADATRSFGVNQDHQAFSLGGFVKSGSDNNHVLLGGGGHAAISGLSVNYANSAGNADTVDGLHASNIARFYLSPMTSGAPADSAKSWFTETMPASSGAIVYNVPGSEKTIIAGKSTGPYGHMLQLNYDDTYLRILRYQAGSWKSADWEKISAGYADSAGKATNDSDGHIINSTYAKLASPNNLVHDDNEITMIPDSYNGDLWLNYQSVGRDSSANITGYIFCDGKEGKLAKITKGQFSGNSATSTKATQDSDGNQINITYLKRSGGTMTGTLIMSGLTSSSWTEGIRINQASNGWATLTLGGTATSGTNAAIWSLHAYNNNFYLANNGSSSFNYGMQCVSGAWTIKGTSLAFGSNTIWHAGNLTKVSQLTNDSGYITQQKKLANYYDSRPTTANIQLGDGSLRHFMATSSMTEGKPAIGDSNIIHLSWDSNGGWDKQIAIADGDNCHIQFRGQSSGTWRNWITVLDSSNSSVGKSGETLTVKINGTSQSLTNSWRGIQDNLTSSSNTTESLSAKQGYLLANGSARDSTKLPLAGGTLSGTLSFSNNIGISGIMGGGSDGWGIVGTGEGDKGRLKIYVTDNATTDWLDFEFRDWEGTTYTPLSMTGNQIIFNYNPTVNGHSLIHTGNIGSQSVASAAKLTTARTIWGQSFDGSWNVSGNMSGVGTISASGDISITNTTAVQKQFKVINSLSELWMGVNGDGETFLWTPSNNRLILGTNNKHSIDILASGNVGIGTTTPSYKLDVNGTLHASGATTLSSTLYVGNNATIAGTLGVYGTTTLKSATTITANAYISGETFFSAVDAFRLNYGSYGVIHRNDGGSYWILLTDKNNQNGGFNSLRPFHIDLSTGTVYMDNNAIIDNLAFTQSNISMGGRVNATYGYDLNTNDYYGLYFKSKNSDSTGILFNDDGNVGINTISPLYKLDVNGTLRVSDTITATSLAADYIDTWSDGTHAHPWYGYDHRYANTGVYSTVISDYFGMTLKTMSGNISITNGGNVGIGTFAPLRKLHVIGEAIFGESGYVASQGTGSAYSGTWVGQGFMELSATDPYIDFHANKSTANFTSRLIQWSDQVRLKYESSDASYNGYILTCEGNHHNPVILGIFDLKRSGPGSTIWTLDNICGPCVFELKNNWGSDTTFNSNTYWTIPTNLLRVEINGTLGANYTTKTTVKAASCIGTVMTRWINNQPVVSNRSSEHVEGCSVECLCTNKAPGTNLYYDSNSPGKYIYITGARPWGYDDGDNGLAMDQFRQTGNLSYLRVRFVVYGWLE